MLSSAEITMNVVHEAGVHQATAYGEHRFAARLAAQAHAQETKPGTNGWRVCKQLGASRERKAS